MTENKKKALEVDKLKDEIKFLKKKLERYMDMVELAHKSAHMRDGLIAALKEKIKRVSGIDRIEDEYAIRDLAYGFIYHDRLQGEITDSLRRNHNLIHGFFSTN